MTRPYNDKQLMICTLKGLSRNTSVCVFKRLFLRVRKLLERKCVVNGDLKSGLVCQQFSFAGVENRRCKGAPRNLNHRKSKNGDTGINASRACASSFGNQPNRNSKNPWSMIACFTPTSITAYSANKQSAQSEYTC